MQARLKGHDAWKDYGDQPFHEVLEGFTSDCQRTNVVETRAHEGSQIQTFRVTRVLNFAIEDVSKTEPEGRSWIDRVVAAVCGS